MIGKQKVTVVMPAYNAADTLEKTFSELDRSIVDEVILVDDGSDDSTAEIARKLGITTVEHLLNMGYGANQKTCYREALKTGADIIIMLHPDYQYTPKLVPSMASMIASGVYDCVLGSRILGKGALKGGMPVYKYIANRFLTLFQNILIGQKLSEFHTGYRAFRAEILRNIPLGECGDDFIFDNQMLVQIHHFGYRIGELSCPTRYRPDSSTISVVSSIKYGLGVIGVSFGYLFDRWGMLKNSLFSRDGNKL